MTEQIIVAVGREYGSGGHVIAEMLAEKLNIPLYDRNLLSEIAQKKNYDINELEKYDETPKRIFLSRSVKGYSNSPEEIIANIQFDYLKEMAAQGESFVIVGRCAESVLRECKNVVSLFILADMDVRLERIMRINGISNSEAKEKILRHDKSRTAYHNRYAVGKWGDSRSYDVCMNSAKLGIEKTAEILYDYILNRMNG